jgi:hypothetical protein
VPIKIIKLLVSELNNAPNAENPGADEEDFAESGDEVRSCAKESLMCMNNPFTHVADRFFLSKIRTKENGKTKMIRRLLQPMTLPFCQVCISTCVR